MRNVKKRKIQLLTFIALIIIFSTIFFLESSNPILLRKILISVAGIFVIGGLSKMIGDLVYFLLEERKKRKRIYDTKITK